MQRYKQLAFKERIKIFQHYRHGLSIRRIAHNLGRSQSTISRELRRNEAPPGEYWPDTAQRLTDKRRRRVSRIERIPDLKDTILKKIKHHGWTPEQIAAFLKYRQKKLPSVSHETIYKWIYDKAQKLDRIWTYLPRHKAKRGLRKPKGKGHIRIPNRISIHERPFKLNNKRQFGHWEGDLMSFCKNSQHMLVLRERKSMFTLSCPLPSKKSLDTAIHMIQNLLSVPEEARKSITLDNGGEFAKHEKCSDYLKELKVYFCDPYKSWQKGGIENTNGRLRRDLPRSTNIKTMKKEEFNEIIQNYNDTPRKKLNWLTPNETFLKNLKRVAL